MMDNPLLQKLAKSVLSDWMKALFLLMCWPFYLAFLGLSVLNLVRARGRVPHRVPHGVLPGAHRKAFCGAYRKAYRKLYHGACDSLACKP